LSHCFGNGWAVEAEDLVLTSGRIIFIQSANRLEQFRALRIIEIFRRNTGQGPGKARDKVGASLVSRRGKFHFILALGAQHGILQGQFPVVLVAEAIMGDLGVDAQDAMPCTSFGAAKSGNTKLFSRPSAAGRGGVKLPPAVLITWPLRG